MFFSGVFSGFRAFKVPLRIPSTMLEDVERVQGFRDAGFRIFTGFGDSGVRILGFRTLGSMGLFRD